MSVSNIMAEKRLRKYRKTFSNSGWKLQPAKAGLADAFAPLDGPVFYLCDFESHQLHVVVTIKNVFDLAQQTKSESGFSFQDICNLFGSLYSDICTGKLALDVETSSILALACSMYISGTQGYKVCQQQSNSDYHFLIIRHWDHSANSSLLRPVPVEARQCYEPQQIESLVDHVLSIDRRNHPARFKSADVIPFKVATRTDLRPFR